MIKKQPMIEKKINFSKYDFKLFYNIMLYSLTFLKFTTIRRLLLIIFKHVFRFRKNSSGKCSTFYVTEMVT